MRVFADAGGRTTKRKARGLDMDSQVPEGRFIYVNENIEYSARALPTFGNLTFNNVYATLLCIDGYVSIGTGEESAAPLLS